MLANKRAYRLTTSLARNYATRHPRPRPGTSERPPLKHRDPLTQSPNATVVELEDKGLTFIHRPPPSAPTPASLTTAPASPLLRTISTPHDGPLPPLLHRQKPQPEYTPVSPENIEKMRQLRASDPKTYSTNKLAQMFACSRMFVGLATRLKTAQLTEIRREQAVDHELRRERWSDRHKLVKAVRDRRRQLW